MIIGSTRNHNNKRGTNQNCIEYIYCQNDLNFSKIEWPLDGISFDKSQFDIVLGSKWESALENGCFWYTLDEVRRRKIDGKFGFIAQLNTKRFNSRRKPAEIHSVQELFLKERFNFTKVKEHEVLLKIISAVDQDREHQNEKENHVIINVSPIDYGHVLFVPDVTSCLPQRLSYDALKMAIEICLLSSDRGLRIGFNSLCAFASVNHLHFHVLYVNHQIPIDRVAVLPINHGLFELQNYFVRGFALQLENRDTHLLARRAFEVASFLYDNGIAHNLFMCRHEPFIAKEDDQESVVRIFIFPKLSAPGVKDTRYLNSCCFDLAGYLLLKDEKEFEDMSENHAISILNRFCLLEDEFDELKNKVDLVWQNLEL